MESEEETKLSLISNKQTTLSLASVARYLSPDVLERLSSVQNDLSKYVKEIEDDPVYWMKQLALLENLPLDPNNKELVGINWKELYFNVKNKGIRELLFHENPTLVRIAYEAENYDIVTIEKILLKAIENDDIYFFEHVYKKEKMNINSEMIKKLLKKSIIEKNHKSFIIAADKVVLLTEEMLKLLSQYGDAEFFDTYITYLNFDTLTDMTTFIFKSYFLDSLVRFDNISIIEHILKIMSSMGTKFFNGWTTLIARAIWEYNFKIIELLLLYKDFSGDRYYEQILNYAIAAGNYVLVRRFIDKFNDPNKIIFLLKSAVNSRNSRTVQILINKIKEMKISVGWELQAELINIPNDSNNRDLNILQLLIESFEFTDEVLLDFLPFFENWSEGYDYIKSILMKRGFNMDGSETSSEEHIPTDEDEFIE